MLKTIEKKYSVPTKIFSNSKNVVLEFNKNNFEKMCNAIGIYKKDFLDSLDKSYNDHNNGDIQKIDNLMDLVK